MAYGSPISFAKAIELLEKGWHICRVAGRFGGQDISDPASRDSFNLRIDTYHKLTCDPRVERFEPEGGGTFGVARYRWKSPAPM
jgi:hypothetical protein